MYDKINYKYDSTLINMKNLKATIHHHQLRHIEGFKYRLVIFYDIRYFISLQLFFSLKKKKKEKQNIQLQ